MKIEEIKSYIENGGKFFVKCDGRVKELRFESIYIKTDCTDMWECLLKYRLAGCEDVKTCLLESYRETYFPVYDDPMVCADDGPICIEWRDSYRHIDGYYICAFADALGWELRASYYIHNYFTIKGYKFVDFHVKEVTLPFSFDVLKEKLTILDKDAYQTEEECRLNSTIEVDYFTD